jgi:outer membrane receptor protein involved in Fe transport
MDRPTRVKKKDRMGVWVSVGAHVAVVVIALIILSQTEIGRQLADKLIGTTRDRQKQQDKPKPPPAQARKSGPPKAAPEAPPPSGGPRRAADAPPAVGDTFFAESSEKKSKSSSTSDSAKTNVTLKVAGPVVKAAPPKLFASAAPKSDIKQLFAERAKEAASVEAFGSEQISKSGVSDAGAIIKNVSGATVVDGKYAVVRGLSDRYVTTTFNGAEIPSADPYRRGASLDLFPAQVIDKVVVSKTFTPDQQGAFTGGGINIVSKSFPDRPFANVSVGAAYNTQATGNENFLTSEGGSLDWLGMDDGTRALPSELESLKVRPPQRVLTTGPRTGPDYEARIQQAELLNRLTRLLGPAQFAPDREAPPFNHNFGAAVGDTTHMFGRPLGVFASLNYKRDFNFYDDGISRRYKPTTGGQFAISKDSLDVLAVDSVNWSGMATLAYQFLNDHVVSFNFLHNQNGTDYVRQQVGTQESDPTATIFQNRLQFTERTLDSFQLRGTDRFPSWGGVQLDWLAVVSETSQDEPDARYFNFKETAGEFATSSSGLPDPGNPTRYFRTLEEQNRNLKLDLTVPFRQWYEEEGLLKLGLFDSLSDRTFQERAFNYLAEPQVFDGNPNNFLRSDNLGYATPRTNASTGRIAYDWMRFVQTDDSFYEAMSGIQAAYFMLDFPIVPKVRLVGGLRLETTDMTVDSVSDIASGVTGLRENHSKIGQTDLLPAAGLIYSVRSDMNLRLHYSQTLARPSFREMAGYRSYDPILDVLLDGNPALTMSASENYDLRWEWFPRPGELFSVTFYYKKIEGAIERIALDNLADNISFINRNSSTVMGIELEARKNLDFLHSQLRNWSLGANFSYIESETSLTDTEFGNKQLYVRDASRTRPLYDQSPYILNVDLNYDNPRTGTGASLILNAAGSRIAIASPIAEDVYEHPPLTLDLVVSQKLGRHLSMKLSARNLLDPKTERTYGEDSNLLFSSYRRGRIFGLSLSYDF